MLAAWACRNSRQVGPERRGAGSRRARASRRRMLVGDAWRPSLTSSPLIRRCPQRGFLPSEPQHKVPDLRRKPRPTGPGTWLPPLPPHRCLVPTQERPRRYQKRQPRRPRQMASGGSQAERDRRAEASAARPGGAESRVHGEAQATRPPSSPGHGDYGQAGRTEPEQRGTETRRTSRDPRSRGTAPIATRVLAPFTSCGSTQARNTWR
jgi:hypothetical protein